jgi:hypothetical protein
MDPDWPIVVAGAVMLEGRSVHPVQDRSSHDGSSAQQAAQSEGGRRMLSRAFVLVQ